MNDPDSYDVSYQTLVIETMGTGWPDVLVTRVTKFPISDDVVEVTHESVAYHHPDADDTLDRVVADMSETLRRAEITTRDLADTMGRILEWHGVDGPMDSQDVLHDRIEAGHAALTRYRQWASGR